MRAIISKPSYASSPLLATSDLLTNNTPSKIGPKIVNSMKLILSKSIAAPPSDALSHV